MKTADVAALVFELQRTSSPVERARVLARAWRTIRGLDPVERRLLAREVGFDGAEELLEGLAGRGAGGVAPAALLEALNRARQDEGVSMRSLVNALRDPGRRDDLLARGFDLAAELVADAADEGVPGSTGPPHVPAAAVPGSQEEDAPASEADRDLGGGAGAPTVPPPPKARPERPGPDPVMGRGVSSGEAPPSGRGRAGVTQPVPVRKPLQAPSGTELAAAEPSIWDRVTPPSAPTTAIESEPPVSTWSSSKNAGASGTVLERLRRFSASIPRLRNGSLEELAAALAELTEPWARRRALLALLEAGIPADPAAAVRLVESELDRPLDRRWCLAALARRGDLAGEALSHALELLTSPSARRRIAALARSPTPSAPTRPLAPT
ncbi:MAG TPA: hypothetical protein VLT32_01370 [Candidatus Sulfomarinibacteraceae bacterium]|nr:hypothetical protein [Candidatus Sulfomarinibacteraceae bacterium]